MKEELLKEFRKEYKRRLTEKERDDKCLSILIERRNILERNPIVKNYMELNEQINKQLEKVVTPDDIYLDTLYDFENMGLMSKTNSILLYMGSFINENGFEAMVGRYNQAAEFDRYADIESLEYIDVPVEDRIDFERDNKVLVLDTDEPSKYLIYEIRDQFINSCLTDGQEAACKKVLSRNKKNL